MQYNPNKKLNIEIESNDMSGANGHTIWRLKDNKRTDTLSRKADAKDFDWMTDKQFADFEKGKYKFTISAADASEYFEYVY